MTNAALAPEVHLAEDHASFVLPRWSSILALRRTILVPYSTIRRVAIEPPERPAFFHLLRLGTHAPAFFWAGTFWVQGERRFYLFSRDDERTLVLYLDGHPFDRIVLGVQEPEVVAAEIRSRIKGPAGSETQSV